MVKVLSFGFVLFCFVFFVESYKCFINEFAFVLVKSYSISPVFLQRTIKKALFLRFLRSLWITFLITLSLEKEVIVLDKSLEKSGILDPKICTNPVTSNTQIWVATRHKYGVSTLVSRCR